MTMRKILRNRVRCNKCGDVIESKSRHDFVSCSCGAIGLDGGHDYQRLVLARGVKGDDFTDMSEYDKTDMSDEARTLFNDVNRGIK